MTGKETRRKKTRKESFKGNSSRGKKTELEIGCEEKEKKKTLEQKTTLGWRQRKGVKE